MTRCFLLFVLVSLCFLVNASDICKTSSVSQKLVDATTDISAWASLTTAAAVVRQVEALQTAVFASLGDGGLLSPKWAGAMIGFDNGDFYAMFGGCDTAGTTPCSPSGQTYLARNAAVFGDSLIRISADTNVTSGNAVTYAWDFLTNEWYTKATASLWGSDNWSINPLSLPVDPFSSTFREVYIYRKSYATHGVLAGLRYAAEPCGTCYVSTFGPTVAVNSAAKLIPTATAINTVADFQQMIDFLLPYVANNTASGSSFATNFGYINFIVGYASDRSFMIKDCGFQQGGGSGQCSIAGTVRYQLWVSAPNIFGNNTRQVYLIDAQGKLGQAVGVGNSPAAPTGAYDVNTRGFFTAKVGWTNINTVADVSATLPRRFVVAVEQGHYPDGEGDGDVAVVGGEFIDNTDNGVCGTSAAASLSAVFAMFTAVIFAAFAMLL